MVYNGWKNYETWAVALWIDNEPPSYKYRCDLAERAKLLARQSNRSAASHLAEMLKDWIENNNPLTEQASVYSDLLNSALKEVDWLEIATNFLSE